MVNDSKAMSRRIIAEFSPNFTKFSQNFVDLSCSLVFVLAIMCILQSLETFLQSRYLIGYHSLEISICLFVFINDAWTSWNLNFSHSYFKIFQSLGLSSLLNTITKHSGYFYIDLLDKKISSSCRKSFKYFEGPGPWTAAWYLFRHARR